MKARLTLHPSSFLLHPFRNEVLMKTRRWKSAARAACLVLAITLAGDLAAAVGARASRAAGVSGGAVPARAAPRGAEGAGGPGVGGAGARGGHLRPLRAYRPLHDLGPRR